MQIIQATIRRIGASAITKINSVPSYIPIFPSSKLKLACVCIPGISPRTAT
uniref:Uncharacterized protein n=1 Tax=Anguilla anguilla TaxID=7936 RepID=A0A0E9R621_ANGAN